MDRACRQRPRARRDFRQCSRAHCRRRCNRHAARQNAQYAQGARARSTNIPDKSRIVTSSMPVTQTFTWDLNGLQRRLGSIDVPAQTGTPSPPSFGIGDVDWKILSKLQEGAIAKAESSLTTGKRVLQSRIRRMAATFEFSADGVSRATISFSLEAMGPRFGVAELAALNEHKLAALEADALKTLGANRQAFLEGVTIGAHPFVRQAGAHAIEVRVRDIPEDSARANYAWIVYDFNGRALDSSKF